MRQRKRQITWWVVRDEEEGRELGPPDRTGVALGNPPRKESSGFRVRPSEKDAMLKNDGLVFLPLVLSFHH
jgi:hypothetical protein